MAFLTNGNGQLNSDTVIIFDEVLIFVKDPNITGTYFRSMFVIPTV